MEMRKEYLQEINDRNALDTVLSLFVRLTCFPVTLDIKFGSRVTIPKASAASDLRKASLHTHQHTNHLQIFTDVPLVSIKLNCLY